MGEKIAIPNGFSISVADSVAVASAVVSYTFFTVFRSFPHSHQMQPHVYENKIIEKKRDWDTILCNIKKHKEFLIENTFWLMEICS